MIESTCEEDGEGVESEADFATGHDFVNAVVEQSDHVEQGHQEGAAADDGGSVVDEV